MSVGLAEVLAEHVEVGGTYWDGDRRSTYRLCDCGVRCYPLVRPSHSDHLVDVVTAWIEERLTGAQEDVTEVIWANASWAVDPVSSQTDAALDVVREALGIEAAHEHEWFDAPRRLCETRAAAGEMCRCGARREVFDDNAGGRA